MTLFHKVNRRGYRRWGLCTAAIIATVILGIHWIWLDLSSSVTLGDDNVHGLQRLTHERYVQPTKNLRQGEPNENEPRLEVVPEENDSSGGPKGQKVVILLTQCRSGSSFTGKIFASTKESMYFYEPLFPFGMKCETVEDYKLAFLGRILNCDFTNLPTAYAVGFEMSKFPDLGKCVKNGLCFAGYDLLQNYGSVCVRMGLDDTSPRKRFNPNSTTCGFPLKGTVLHKQCTAAKIIFTKVTRACSIDRLQIVYDFLKKKGKDVYVIHLVRDPRSTTFSQYKAFQQKAKRDGLSDICVRLRKTLGLVKKPTSGNEDEKVLKLVQEGKYMRIRFEDLSMDAVGSAEKIFRFIGRKLPPEVDERIRESLQLNKTELEERKNSNDSEADEILKQMKNKYSTARDSKEVLRRWRKDIPFDLAMTAQRECSDVMELLGYIPFNNEAELRNTSFPFFLN